MRRDWTLLVLLGFLVAERLDWPLLIRAPIYAAGLVLFVQVLRRKTVRERWWTVSWLGFAVVAATGAELAAPHSTTRRVMGLLVAGALIAMLAPSVIRFLKVSKESVALVFRVRARLKDIRAGRRPPQAQGSPE